MSESLGSAVATTALYYKFFRVWILVRTPCVLAEVFMVFLSPCKEVLENWCKICLESIPLHYFEYVIHNHNLSGRFITPVIWQSVVKYTKREIFHFMNSAGSTSCSTASVIIPFPPPTRFRRFFLFYAVLLVAGYFPCTNPLAVIDSGALKPLAIESDAGTTKQWRCSVVLTAVMSQQVRVPPAMEFWLCLHSPYYEQGKE
jgi:hypothetical protein